MDKNTILYIGGFELPDKNAAAQRVIANGKIFRDLGYRVAFLGMDKSAEAGTNVLDTQVDFFGFNCWSSPYPKNNVHWLKAITSVSDLKAIINGPLDGTIHSIICYNHPAIAQEKIKRICKAIGANFIADTTEWYDSSGGNPVYRIVKSLDTTLRMKVSNRNADGLIVTSQYLHDFYKARVSKIVNLPTLYDRNNMPLPKLAKQGQGMKPKDTVRLMYAGSAFSPKQGTKDYSNIKDRLDIIVDIFSKVYAHRQNFELNIFGLTEENFLRTFPHLKAPLGNLNNQIRFHGRVPHQRVLDEITRSDYAIFFRHPRRVIEAGFPSKFSEAITFGTPVICNSYSSIEPYAVANKNYHEIPLNNADDQVKKMVSILDSPRSMHHDMKVYCREHNTFDYRSFIKPVDAFLKSLNTNDRP